MTHPSKIKTIGDLRRAREAAPEAFPRRPVKHEVRDNLIKKLAAGESLDRFGNLDAAEGEKRGHHVLRIDGHIELLDFLQDVFDSSFGGPDQDGVEPR